MYVTLSILRASKASFLGECSKYTPDWTFTKLLKVSLQSVPQSEWLYADGDEPVCELRKEMNAHSAELVQVPLQFIIDQCCRVNGSFVR